MIAQEHDACAQCQQQLFGGTRIEATLLQSCDEPLNARDPFFSIADVLVDVKGRRVS